MIGSFVPRAIQYVEVSADADGDNTIVSAPGSTQRILVLGYQLRFVGAGDYTVQSGSAGSTHLAEVGAATPGTRVSYSGGDPEIGAFLCDAGAALVISNPTDGAVTGHLSYRLVQA